MDLHIQGSNSVLCDTEGWMWQGCGKEAQAGGGVCTPTADSVLNARQKQYKIIKRSSSILQGRMRNRSLPGVLYISGPQPFVTKTLNSRNSGFPQMEAGGGRFRMVREHDVYYAPHLYCHCIRSHLRLLQASDPRDWGPLL